MVAFATDTQMEARSNGAITTASHPALPSELEAASQAIRNACGWHVAPIETVRHQRFARIPQVVFLPAMMIRDITAAKINGQTLDPAAVSFDPMTGETNLYGRVLDISYSCGFEQTPADITALTLDMVASSLGGAAEGLAREQAGAVSVTYREYAEAEVRSRLSAYVIGRIP